MSLYVSYGQDLLSSGSLVLAATQNVLYTSGSLPDTIFINSLSAATPQDVAATGNAGAASSASHSDHAHRGVSSVSVAGGAYAYGNIQLSAGSNVTLSQTSGSITIASSGGGGGTLDPTTPQAVGASGAVGTSGSSSHGDHIHQGVTGIYTAPNAIQSGVIDLAGSNNITVTQSSGSFTLGTSGSFVPVIHDINGVYHGSFPLSPANGGTGVNNALRTLTILNFGGTLSFQNAGVTLGVDTTSMSVGGKSITLNSSLVNGGTAGTLNWNHNTDVLNILNNASISGTNTGDNVFDTGSPVDVGATAVTGTSGSVPHQDHVHRGLHGIYTAPNGLAYGDITLVGSGNITIAQSSGSFTIAGDQGALYTEITDDTTSNITTYPTWVSGTSGSQAQRVSSTKLTFNPSAGLLSTIAGSIIGTAGAGYVDFIAQSSNPSTPPAGTVRFHSSTTQGFTRFEQDNEATTNLILGRDNVFIAKNTSGGNIAKGKPVYVTGSTGNVPNIALAKADSITTLPAVGMTLDAINTNNFGQVMIVGIVGNVDTSGYSTGDQLWVSPTTSGSLVNTRPAYPNLVQRIGSVLVSNVGTGSILVDVAPFIGGLESGTTSNSWTAARGINLAGTANQIVMQSAGVTGTLGWTPTSSNKLIVLPDTSGSVVVGSGTTGRIAEWVTNANTLQASTLIKTGAGVLTFDADQIGSVSFSTMGGNGITFDCSALTAEQIYSLPNLTGTVALGAGTATVSSANSVTVASHTHAVTSNSNPGIAASLLASSTSGSMTLQGMTLNQSLGVGYNVVIPATVGTAGQGLYFSSGSGNVASFQALDAGGTSYTFFSANRYFDGTNWQQLNPRTGSTFQLGGDSIGFYTFGGSSSTPVLRLSLSNVGVLSLRGNTTAPSAGFAGTTVHVAQADTTNNRIMLDAYGAFGDIDFRRSDGTAASKSALQINDIMGIITASGYGATGYTASSPAQIRFVANQNWTDVNQGSRIQIYTSADNTTGAVLAATVGNDKSLAVVGSVNIGGDTGGVASNTTITNATNTTLTNAYVVKGGQAASTINTGWIKIFIGTNAAWIPYWQNATP